MSKSTIGDLQKTVRYYSDLPRQKIFMQFYIIWDQEDFVHDNQVSRNCHTMITFFQICFRPFMKTLGKSRKRRSLQSFDYRKREKLVVAPSSRWKQDPGLQPRNKTTTTNLYRSYFWPKLKERQIRFFLQKVLLLNLLLCGDNPIK